MRQTLKHLFTPHHTNNYRARILHQTGLTVLLGVFILFESTLQLLRYAPTEQLGFVLGYASSIDEAQVIELTNQERASQDLPSLEESKKLSSAAQQKALHMFSNDYWAHISPDGVTPWSFMEDQQYSYRVAGENLARDYDTTRGMLDGWMNSPTHRDNIVSPKFSEIGVAVVNGTLQGVETTLVVQMFGRPALSDTLDSSGAIPPTQIDNNVSAVITQSPRLENSSVPEVLSDTDTIEIYQASPNSQNIIAAISPESISRTVSFAVILLLFATLLYDAAAIKKEGNLPRYIGKHAAHYGLLALLAIFVLLLKEGQII